MRAAARGVEVNGGAPQPLFFRVAEGPGGEVPQEGKVGGASGPELETIVEGRRAGAPEQLHPVL